LSTLKYLSDVLISSVANYLIVAQIYLAHSHARIIYNILLYYQLQL